MLKDFAKKIFFSFAFFLCLSILIFFSNSFVFAKDYYQVNPGQTIEITAYTVCKKVSNAPGNHPTFVPVKSSAEWAEFRSHHPGHITLGDCGASPPPSECTQDSDCGSLTWWCSAECKRTNKTPYCSDGNCYFSYQTVDYEFCCSCSTDAQCENWHGRWDCSGQCMNYVPGTCEWYSCGWWCDGGECKKSCDTNKMKCETS